MGSGQSALNKGDGFPSCAKWISDTSLRFGKRESPTPLVFQKELRLSVLPRRAEILCTATPLSWTESQSERTILRRG